MAVARSVTLFRPSYISIVRNCLPINSFTDVDKTPKCFYSSSCSSGTADDPRSCFDIVIVGGGIVGIASARQLKIRDPTLRICVLEKENILAPHQSSHNSGVIHSGVYYKPGSLRAKLCVEGQSLTYEYADENRVPYKKCGKLIVATNEIECKNLMELQRRGIANKVKDMKLIGAKEIKKYEPFCKGVAALWCPHTGIIDYKEMTYSLACDFKSRGGKIFTDFKVKAFRETKDLLGPAPQPFPVTVQSVDDYVRTRFVLTCCGLQSDQLAMMSGCKEDPKIVPFRGEYLVLNPKKAHMIKGNIYPVPDPRFPFLGVHFTPRMDGTVLLGPNAVLAFKREGYSWTDVNVKELAEVLKFPGFRKLALKYVSYGCGEMLGSFFHYFVLKELRKYIPDLELKDLSRGLAGVRAQAMDREGNLVEDFVFDSGDGPLMKRVLHLRNAPSPGATSSLAIAKVITDKVVKQMDDWNL